MLAAQRLSSWRAVRGAEDGGWPGWSEAAEVLSPNASIDSIEIVFEEAEGATAEASGPSLRSRELSPLPTLPHKRREAGRDTDGTTEEDEEDEELEQERPGERSSSPSSARQRDRGGAVSEGGGRRALFWAFPSLSSPTGRGGGGGGGGPSSPSSCCSTATAQTPQRGWPPPATQWWSRKHEAMIVHMAEFLHDASPFQLSPQRARARAEHLATTHGVFAVDRLRQLWREAVARGGRRAGLTRISELLKVGELEARHVAWALRQWVDLLNWGCCE